MLNSFQRLVSLDSSFAGLETKAQAFHAAQTLQAEAQTRLHDQMQVEMYVTRSLLTDVTSSAAKLQSAVDNTSAKIAQMATLGGLSAAVTQWSWLILVVLIVYQFSRRFAGYATATIGKSLIPWHTASLCRVWLDWKPRLPFTYPNCRLIYRLTGTYLLYSISGTMSPFDRIHPNTVLVHSASGYQIPVLALAKAAICLSILVAIGILYNIRARLSKLTKPHFNVSSDLP